MRPLPSLFDLHGRTAFITGSTRGLGWSSACCLAELGATVAINGRSERSVDARCREIEQAGGQALSAACDVTNGDVLNAVLDDVSAKTGGIDILIASAAQFMLKPIEESSDDDINTLFAGKLFSAMVAARKLAPAMKERRWGRIVLMSSISTKATGGHSPVDTAASGAMTAFAKSLSTALAPYGITCNAVSPGFMHTDTTDVFREIPDNAAWISSRVPAQRWGRPEEIGWPTAFLCTEAASFITGHTLVIDGGITSSL